MKSRSDCQILLLSTRPEVHRPVLRALRRIGVLARAASDPGGALRSLRARPGVVLVDLVHGPGLDPTVVSTLNRDRGGTVVLALHAGGFGRHHEDVAELSVDGFCPIGDWGPVVGATVGHPSYVSTTLH
ncbi:MAG: hypothetical protein A2W00_08630 [Candidatus Eisenbacteria bacterium RBG_16_71_46]|nr:MAG: hypothetical protein A2W00_08630 [Candidatus Eisenbacteria bacterium RBG_16_71_46]OGF21120.1 MAG: hypothetical protein A2V63_07205 [Candidatus Eisenbacteria bacterium RBG_19FT_COMBO_70_11]